ncbi:MAG: hypothetical protein AAF642_01960 [Pseudomonadota bacterium]
MVQAVSFVAPSICILICAAIVQAQAQGASPEEHGIERRFEMMDRASEYKRGQYPPNFWERSGSDQKVSMVGREDLIPDITPEEKARSSYKCESDSVAPVIDQIAEIARDHSLVIINEDHAKPHHRQYIRQLAVRLRKDGFTHYAAETFSPSIVEGTGFPVIWEGVYTTEPMMSRLVEDIRSVGFKLVPYEMRWDQFPPSDAEPKVQQATREEAQAQNIMDAVLSQNPDTKIIIHVGHGHGQETVIPSPDFVPLMGARLKQKSGLDPLTIELTQCESGSEKVVLSDTPKTATGGPVPKFMDYWVGFPSMSFERGRPTYRYKMGDTPVDVPHALRPKEGAVVIEARPVDADLIREPIERLYLEPGEELPLMLPSGIWSLIAFGRDGSVSETVTVEVSNP